MRSLGPVGLRRCSIPVRSTDHRLRHAMPHFPRCACYLRIQSVEHCFRAPFDYAQQYPGCLFGLAPMLLPIPYCRRCESEPQCKGGLGEVHALPDRAHVHVIGDMHDKAFGVLATRICACLANAAKGAITGAGLGCGFRHGGPNTALPYESGTAMLRYECGLLPFRNQRVLRETALLHIPRDKLECVLCEHWPLLWRCQGAPLSWKALARAYLCLPILPALLAH